MLNSLRISTLAAALAVGTVGLSTVALAAQPNLKGTQFDRPDVVVLDSGLQVGAPEAHQVFYSWDEVNRRIQAEGVQPAAASRGASAGQNVAYNLRGTQFDRPDVTVHSWGIEVGGADDNHVQYTWAEVNKKINADVAANRY